MADEKDLESISGVGSKTADKLRDAGYEDLKAVAVAPTMKLSEDADISESKARKIISNARSNLEMGFASAKEVQEEVGKRKRITTGSEKLDELLGGGIPTKAITEFYADFGGGKTQLAMQLAVNVQLPEEKGGMEAQAVFVDNENTFSPKRVVQMAKGQGLDPDEVLSDIKVARAFSTDHQMLLANKIPELVKKEDLDLGLVVIDSLTGLFRAEYVGRGSLADRQQKLNRHIHELQRIADRFNCAIYVTNQVMAQPDVFFGNPTKAVGGHILAHGSTYRIYLRKSKGDKRIARLVASPDLPEGEAVFKIKGEGIVD